MSQDPFDEYESGGPLANLARIKKVVGVPATLWLGLLALETILHAFDVPQDSDAHRYLRGFVAYVLPLLLYWTVLATFYCSYTILNRRGGLKSVLTFGFVQALTLKQAKNNALSRWFLAEPRVESLACSRARLNAHFGLHCIRLFWFR